MAEPAGGGAKAALLAAMVVAAAVAVVVADDGTPAGAAELATFSSCEELASWMDGAEANLYGGREVSQQVSDDDSAAGASGEESAPPVPAPAASEGSASEGSASEGSASEGSASVGPGAAGGGGAGGTGSTNVIVEGIDELDLVEELEGGLVLAVGERTLHLVDVAAARSVSSIPVPHGAQVSFDPARSLLWAAGSDGPRTEVVRARLDGSVLAVEGSWSSDGYLLTARRSGDGLHVVLTGGGGGAIPFGDGPVPCDEVLHPTGPALPEATMLVNLPPTGEVTPAAATEIVGAGQMVHVTSEEVVVATPLRAGEPVTSLHRFDLDTLTHTGSGRVEGYLLNELALSVHDGHLRVAVTHGGGGSDDVEPLPVPVEPGPGSPVPPPPGGGGDPLNEVVVLDTDGELDVVGRSSRFGLPGETLQGIRFVGTTAYAVTFLQTDPFYVLDLTDPASPRVVGSVKLPGFSSYLHPVGPGVVVGFGPDGEGKVAAKLFDVSDPAAPAVADSIVLGDESPVAWDHHAFLGLGDGRFAVPALRWEVVEPAGCTPERRTAIEQQAIALEQQLAEGLPGPEQEALRAELDALWSDPCLSPGSRTVSSIVELEARGGSLREVSRVDVAVPDLYAERVLRVEGRWVLHTRGALVVVDDPSSPTMVPLA